MSADVLRDEVVDTSDLGMLNGVRHCGCGVCYPVDLKFGEKFVAICGRTVLASGRTDWRTPPNHCQDCERLRYDGCCPRCGA